MLAPAKVNLFLHVGAVRDDGRHPLDSLTVFAGPEAADRLSLEDGDTLSLTVSGLFAEGAGPDADNLVLHAAAALGVEVGQALYGSFALEKTLPTAAGIGGGSADAGAALRLLCVQYGIDPGHAEAVAPTLGGDVLAAFHNTPCLMRGDGDQVTLVSALPPLYAALVNPGVPCPTGAVFRRYDEAGGGTGFAELELPRFSDATSLIQWLAANTRNDLEAPAKALVPEIAELLDVLERLDGARLARMSGSGATCFALFETIKAAEGAAARIQLAYPDWWARASTLGIGA